jgi:hypothetical protein
MFETTVAGSRRSPSGSPSRRNSGPIGGSRATHAEVLCLKLAEIDAYSTECYPILVGMYLLSVSVLTAALVLVGAF